MKMSKRSFYFWWRCRDVIDDGHRKKKKVVFKKAKAFHKYLLCRDMYMGELVIDLMKKGYIKLANEEAHKKWEDGINKRYGRKVV
jgi:hypothetical protein